EAFRPFALAVTLEEVDYWFEVAPLSELPYMIVIVNCPRRVSRAVAGHQHIDGSARVQTASAADNPEFHLLLREVGKVTGREMVLNTSFNVKGQPIVNTSEGAVETFLGAGIEYLFFGEHPGEAPLNRPRGSMVDSVLQYPRNGAETCVAG